MPTIRFILTNLDRYTPLFILLLIVGVVDGSAMFLIPALLAEFTRGELTVEAFRGLAPLLVGLYVMSLGLSWWTRNYGEALGYYFGNHLRNKLFRRIELLPFDVHVRHHSGYLLSLVARVCDSSGSLLTTAIWLVGYQVATLGLFFWWTSRESLLLAALNLTVLVLFLVVSVLLSKQMVPLMGELNLRGAALGERLVDLLGNIMTIKKLGVFNFAERQLTDCTDAVNAQVRKVQRFHANRWLLLHGLFGFAQLGTILTLLYGVAQGSVSPAILVLFVAAYGSIKNQVERLSEFVRNALELAEYIRPLSVILEHSVPEVGRPLSPTWQRFSLKGVRFQYPNSNVAIRIPEFEIDRGEVASVAGRSGNGKSTMLNLLGGLWTPLEGECRVDESRYEEILPSSLRRSITILSQEVELFNLSVRDNIALGRDVSDDKLREILDGLDMGKWLAELPQGLDTFVGEKGVRLSTGQKQRINLARAVVLRSELTLLDEPTAHLDATTERVVVEYLKKALAGCTMVVVSHHNALHELATRGYRFDQHSLSRVR